MVNKQGARSNGYIFCLSELERMIMRKPIVNVGSKLPARMVMARLLAFLMLWQAVMPMASALPTANSKTPRAMALPWRSTTTSSSSPKSANLVGPIVADESAAQPVSFISDGGAHNNSITKIFPRLAATTPATRFPDAPQLQL